MADDFKAPEPVKTEPAKPNPFLKKELVKAMKESDIILEQMNKILVENDGLLSNVPIDSEYWGLSNRFMALRRSGK